MVTHSRATRATRSDVTLTSRASRSSSASVKLYVAAMAAERCWSCAKLYELRTWVDTFCLHHKMADVSVMVKNLVEGSLVSTGFQALRPDNLEFLMPTLEIQHFGAAVLHCHPVFCSSFLRLTCAKELRNRCHSSGNQWATERPVQHNFVQTARLWSPVGTLSFLP